MEAGETIEASARREVRRPHRTLCGGWLAGRLATLQQQPLHVLARDCCVPNHCGILPRGPCSWLRNSPCSPLNRPCWPARLPTRPPAYLPACLPACPCSYWRRRA